MKALPVHMKLKGTYCSDVIFTTCGIPIPSNSKAYVTGGNWRAILLRKRGVIKLTEIFPETVTCKSCLKTKKWKQEIANVFIDRMRK